MWHERRNPKHPTPAVGMIGSQKETRPTYSEMVKKEEAQAEEDPYYRAQCTKPWNDPFADSDKEWQQREDIDEDTWREKRNEVMGWE